MSDWLKNNWITLLVFVVVLFSSLWVKHRFDQSILEEVQAKYVEELSKQRKSYDSQISKINKINKETLEKQSLLIEDYKNYLDLVQAEYEQKVKELEDLRSAKIKELAKKINENPEQVLDNLANKFGFEVVKIED